MINSGPFTAEEARQEKLVDALQYYDELLDTLKTASPDEDVQVVKPDYERKRKVPDMNSFAGLMQLLSMLNPPQRTPTSTAANQIALIYANGPILPNVESFFASMPVITPETLKEAFEKARTDDSVRAVVLRIDSPGGSALASDLIWREVVLTQREKPVVVSMGDIAASGGYYIAMAAGTIVAHPSTLTGSIGVFGGKLNMKGFYNKVGLTKDIIAHGQNATLYSDYSGFTPDRTGTRRKDDENGVYGFCQQGGSGAEANPLMKLMRLRKDAFGPASRQKHLDLLMHSVGLRLPCQSLKSRRVLPMTTK